MIQIIKSEPIIRQYRFLFCEKCKYPLFYYYMEIKGTIFYGN